MLGRKKQWQFDAPFVSTDYRRTSRNNRILVGFVSIAGLAIFFFCLFLPDNSDSSALLHNQILQYNHSYPFTKPRNEANKDVIFRIAVIADPDKSSRKDDSYHSQMIYGTLAFNEHKPTVAFDAEPIKLKSGYSLSGRGMELSDLTVFNGHLLTVDDRTGIVFKISPQNKMIPWLVLSDGDGTVEKGFKGEWMTVKDRQLIVGGMGKEYTQRDGSIAHHDPEFVKFVTPGGAVTHHNWRIHFDQIRAASGHSYPAYLLHESMNWSAHHKKWFFLPRRVSKEPYDEVLDEGRCGNLLISASEDFEQISVIPVGTLNTKRGFSAFKFIPNTRDRFALATKTEEDPASGKMRSYITVFDVTDGSVIMADQLIGDDKFEGVEFV